MYRCFSNIKIQFLKAYMFMTTLYYSHYQAAVLQKTVCNIKLGKVEAWEKDHDLCLRKFLLAIDWQLEGM